MKKQLTTITLAFLSGCSIYTLNGQQAIGLYTGNHNVPYSAFQNPSNTFADKNYVYLNVWGANLGFTNNWLTYNAPFGIVKWANSKYPDKYTATNGKLKFDQDWLQWNKNNNQKLYYLNEVYGPSAFFRISSRTGVGFGARKIAGISMTGVGPDLSMLMRYGLDSLGAAFNGANGLQRNKTYSNDAFSINVMEYQEWFFSLAQVTRDKGPHFLKWGATAKLLLSNGAAHIGADKLDFGVTSTNDLQIKSTNGKFLHTTDESVSTALNHPLGFNFNFVNGVGAGMDIGFTYEHRSNTGRKTIRDRWNCSDEVKNEYDWKFAASVTDLGLIWYDGSSRKMANDKMKSWAIDKNIVNNYQYTSGDRFEKVDNGYFDDSSIAAGAGNSFVLSTPMALNASLDVNLKSNFYFGINWSQSLKNANALGLRKASYLNVTPRWEKEYTEIGLPITLTRDYTALNVGLYGRVGPVTIGTDNLSGLANLVAGNPYKSANIYAALRFQIKACDWLIYHYQELEPTLDTVTTDTNFWNKDSVKIIKTDTVYREKIIRDTIKIEKRDTVYKNGSAINPDLKKKQDELKLRDEELKRKEEELRKREDDVKKRENRHMGDEDDCKSRIIVLEDALKREKALNDVLTKNGGDNSVELSKQKARVDALEKEILTLKLRIGSLQNDSIARVFEIARLKEEIARLKKTNTPCDKQVKTLDSLLVIEIQKNGNLGMENSKQKAVVIGLEKDNKDLKDRIKSLEDELSKQKAIVIGSKKQNEDDAKKIADLESQIAVLKAKGNDCSDCEAKLKTLESELSKQKAIVSGLKIEIEDVRKEYAFEVAKNKELTEKLKNCGSSDEAAKLKTQLALQQKRCDSLANVIAVLQNENVVLDKEYSAQKAKVTALQKEVDDLKNKLTEKDKQIVDLQEKLKNCGNSEELAKAKSDLDAEKKKNEELEAKLKVIAAEKAKLETELSGAKTKISALESDLKACSENDCEKIKTELAEWKEKYNTLKKEDDVLHEEYDALLADRNKIKAQLVTCQEQLKNAGSDTTKIKSMQKEIDKLKNTITVLNGEVDSKQKSLDALQDDYDKLVAENDGLKKQIAELQLQITKLNAKVADLEAQLKECKSSSGGGGGPNPGEN